MEAISLPLSSTSRSTNLLVQNMRSGTSSGSRWASDDTRFPLAPLSASTLEGKDPSICTRCLALNLNEMLSKTTTKRLGHMPLAKKELGLISTWSVESCNMCRFFFQSLNWLQKNSKEFFYLKSYQSEYSRGQWHSIPVIFLMIDVNSPTPPWLEHKPGNRKSFDLLDIPRIVPIAQYPNNALAPLSTDGTNFGIVKDWLQLCKRLHKENCGWNIEPHGVPYLKVIDCRSKSITLALGQPYVSLSYVWGSMSNNVQPGHRCVAENSGTLPKTLPKTIEDAITVTQKLGYQYLWVDRYCIDQDNSEEVMTQVRQMDLVYQKSALTIIAAAGDSPDYGLPGVGSRDRVTQPSLCLGERKLISTLHDPRYDIAKSTWMSRAWTYQEGLLSRQRLIFTDYQVYFECNGMRNCEAHNFPLKNLHTQNQQRLREKFCENRSMIGIFPLDGIGKHPFDIMRRIEEYSLRSLSYQGDILNGFLGILRAFEKSSLQVRHCWGVPLLLDFNNSTHAASCSACRPTFYPDYTCFIRGLTWYLPTPSPRRNGFPSWSWTGWIGPVEFDQIHANTYDAEMTVNLEFRNGRTSSWEEFQEGYEQFNKEFLFSTYVHLSIYTSSLRFEPRELYSKFNKVEQNSETYILRIFGENDTSATVKRWSLTTTRPLDIQARYTGLHVGNTKPSKRMGLAESVRVEKKGWPSRSNSRYHILIAENMGDYYERIGWATLGWDRKESEKPFVDLSGKLKHIRLG
ncbi:heterokaryon incompatibility protein-domain-containing protein [Tricladium varicosporioides]|nr:heterokaryon incompatibility protein-domain-containing protein [Hymenoscyphus varicosporioides]